MKKNFVNTIDLEKKRRFTYVMASLTLTVFTMTLVLFFTMTVSSKNKTNVNMTKTEKYLFGVGNYGNAPDEFVSTEPYYNKNLMTEWYNTYSNDPDKLAYMMYRYACLTYGTTSGKCWHLFGTGNVSAVNATGKLTASGYRYEKRRGDTMLADTVLQNVNLLSDLEGDASSVTLLEIARSLVEYGEQRVYSEDYEYILTADDDSFEIEDEYDLASATFTGTAKRYDNNARVSYKKSKGYVYREYSDDWYDEYGLNSPEKTDHIINTESIIKNSAKITPKTIDGHKCYSVYFEIDTNKVLSSGTTATYYFEQFIINHLDLKDSIFTVNVKYNTLAITMEVWDCGYIRSWNTDENWSVTASLWGITVPCVTDISTIEYYSYDPADNLFDEALSSLQNKCVDVNPDGSDK